MVVRCEGHLVSKEKNELKARSAGPSTHLSHKGDLFLTSRFEPSQDAGPSEEQVSFGYGISIGRIKTDNSEKFEIEIRYTRIKEDTKEDQRDTSEFSDHNSCYRGNDF